MINKESIKLKWRVFEGVVQHHITIVNEWVIIVVIIGLAIFLNKKE